jgi:molybdopterin molybdotransferase
MTQDSPKPLTTNHEPLTTHVSFEQALQTVKDKVTAASKNPSTEIVPLEAVRGRILAEDARADRDCPPFHRSIRDGFAVRSDDLASIPATLECVAEVAAGSHYHGSVTSGRCVSIMTGAPLPDGADAVVMIEKTEIQGSNINILDSVRSFENVVRQGSEAAKGSVVLRAGRKIGSGDIGLLASVGLANVKVFRQPRVTILTTGDELVPVEGRPKWFQVRNSNAFSLASQVAEAGGVPRMMGIAPDRLDTLKLMIEEGLEDDLLVMSGGVSAGKYDLVERALAELGAEFYFRSVALRPGKPLVFGQAKGKFFFGLPGNPVSSYVTFEIFARRAIGMFSGAGFEDPVFLGARSAKPVAAKKDLTTFRPARVAMTASGPMVDLVGWQGSGDLVGASAANCFLVLHAGQRDVEAGDWVLVMLKDWVH